MNSYTFFNFALHKLSKNPILSDIFIIELAII